MCGNDAGNRSILARELMFGTLEAFPYVECGSCGCLQIARIPNDLGRYYPRNYVSFRESRRRITHAPRNFWRRRRALHLYAGHSALGWLVARLSGTPEHATWMQETGAAFDSRIADVGCGSGNLLRALQVEGFRDLTGIDPFVPEALDEPGLRILKAQVSEVDEIFDVVMLHHSLEHMPDQLGAMRAVRRIVDPDGTVLVRIPLVASAWRTYGIHWVGLDAPRHLVVHTERSMRELAERAGFTVARVEYDSTGCQFWASEQYRMGVPLHDPRSCIENRDHPLFTAAEMGSFASKARQLNADRDGDQGCFYLHPR